MTENSGMPEETPRPQFDPQSGYPVPGSEVPPPAYGQPNQPYPPQPYGQQYPQQPYYAAPQQAPARVCTSLPPSSTG